MMRSEANGELAMRGYHNRDPHGLPLEIKAGGSLPPRREDRSGVRTTKNVAYRDIKDTNNSFDVAGEGCSSVELPAALQGSGPPSPNLVRYELGVLDLASINRSALGGASPGAHASECGISAISTIVTADQYVNGDAGAINDQITLSGASVSDRGDNILLSLNQNSPKVLSDGIVGAIITPGTDTIGFNKGVNPDAESVNARSRSLALSGVQDSGEVGSHNDSTVAAGAVLAGPTITDTVHVGAASIPALNGSAKSNVSGIGPAKGTDASGHAKEIGSGIGSGVFPPHMPLLGTANDVLGKLHEATKAAHVTCASHHSTSIKSGDNFPYVRALSWAPKKGTNADPLDHEMNCKSTDFGYKSKAADGYVPISRPSWSNDQIIGEGQRESFISPAPLPSWKSLFTSTANSGTKSPLEYFAPTRVNGKPVIQPPVDAVAEGTKLWEGCLVGQFFDKRLPLHVVRAAVEKLWGKREMPEISITDNGLYLFRFKDMAARDWVMECGPWYIAGRPFVIRKWQPGMEMLNIQLTSLPIWVKFFNIPLEYWTNTCLGYIASAVGKPLHLDSPTENRSRLSFARICVEVDLNCDFPKSALLNLGNDRYTTVRIEYPWVPHSCSHCKVYGHKTLHCPISKAKNTKLAPDGPNISGAYGGEHGNAVGTNTILVNKYDLGEVLSVCCLLWLPFRLVVLFQIVCSAIGLFGNKFLIIQKKKK